MSISVIKLILDSALRQPHKAVAAAIARYLDDAKPELGCRPSVETIAGNASVCEKTARTCIAELSADGLIEYEYRFARTSYYWINCPAFEAIARPIKPKRGPGRPRKDIHRDGNPPVPGTAGFEPDAEIPRYHRQIPRYAVPNPPVPGSNSPGKALTYDQSVINKRSGLDQNAANSKPVEKIPTSKPETQPPTPTPTPTPNATNTTVVNRPPENRLGRKPATPNPGDTVVKLADLDHRKIPATDPNANTAKQEAERQRQMAAIAALAAKLTAPTKVNGSNK